MRLTSTLSPTSLERFVARPEGRYYAGFEFCAFCTAGPLFGVIVWGRPTLEVTRAMLRAHEAQLRVRSHRAVFDYRLLEAIDHDAFHLLCKWMTTNAARLGRVTSRAAVLKPTDVFAGAVVGGFYSVVPIRYPARLYATPAEAEDWLEVPVAGVLERLREVSRAGTRATSDVARVLGERPGLSIAEVARRLRVTSRTLQRRLRSEGTSFSAEARRAKVLRAKQLLATSDAKLAVIAREVGCASVGHFSVMFREIVGVPPATWRQRVWRDAE